MINYLEAAYYIEDIKIKPHAYHHFVDVRM
jgi:hypothetical protein